MLKFLADENIAPKVIQALRGEGFQIKDVYELGLVSAPDREILQYAQKENIVILTHDKDFGNLIRQPQQNHGGVVLLRLRNQSSSNVIYHLIPFLKDTKSDKIKNHLVIFREGYTRFIT